MYPRRADRSVVDCSRQSVVSRQVARERDPPGVAFVGEEGLRVKPSKKLQKIQNCHLTGGGWDIVKYMRFLEGLGKRSLWRHGGGVLSGRFSSVALVGSPTASPETRQGKSPASSAVHAVGRERIE